MPSSLTSTKIKNTYGQILHVDGGVTTTPKTVYDGDGTAIALKVSTTDVQVNNSPVLTDADIGSTVQAYDPDLTAWSGKTAPSGTVVGTSDSQALSNKSFSDNPVYSAGTANAIAYLNGSKVLTTGSALTFDGTNFATTGTSSATKFIPTGGAATGNGMYLPAANNLGWSINGSEQMRLTSTGLGIGTSSPSSKLDVRSNNPSNTGGITLQTASAGNIGTFWTTLTDLNIGITGAHKFTNYDGSVERMRIDSSGNVSIGTTGLSSRFNVQSTSGVVVNISSGDTTTGAAGTGPTVQFTAHDGNSSVGIATISALKENATVGNRASYLTLATRPSGGSVTERMRIDSSGNLGLGVTPEAWTVYKALQIGTYNAALYARDGINQVYLGVNHYYDGTWKYGNTAAATRYLQEGGGHLWYTAPSGTADTAISWTQAMTLDASGNLLVGTTTAGASKLVVNSDSIQVNTAKTPASASATGTTGQIAWDANYIYVCVATNTWKRSALSTW